MTTTEIANRLVELCRQGKFKEAQSELYAQDAVSTEAEATPEFAKETKGLDDILKKADTFDSLVEEMHSMEVSDPLVGTNSFACTMTMDMKMKGQERMKMTELCVYGVKGGKVASEEFFM